MMTLCKSNKPAAKDAGWPAG